MRNYIFFYLHIFYLKYITWQMILHNGIHLTHQTLLQYQIIMARNKILTAVIQGKGENMWKFKISNMTFRWWLETWGGLAKSSLRWLIQNCTPHNFLLLGIWISENFRFGIAHCPMFAGSNSIIPNFRNYPKHILVLEIGGNLIN